MRQGRTQNFGEEQMMGFRGGLVSGVFPMHPGQAPMAVGAIPTAQAGYILQPSQQAANGSQAVKHKIVKRRLKSHFCFVFRNANFRAFRLLLFYGQHIIMPGWEAEEDFWNTPKPRFQESVKEPPPQAWPLPAWRGQFLCGSWHDRNWNPGCISGGRAAVAGAGGTRPRRRRNRHRGGPAGA